MASAAGGPLLFGGFDNNSATGGFFSETWQWNGTAWSQLAASGPPGRESASLASY
jgi:hypothetical protein